MKCMPHVYAVFVSLLFRIHDNKWISPNFNSIHLSARLCAYENDDDKKVYMLMIYSVVRPLNCIAESMVV